MSGDDNRDLAPPPRIEAHSQLHPPSEFRFADQADPPWEAEYENFQPVEPDPIEDRPVLTPEDEERAIAAAREDERVLDRLEDHRHETLGAGLFLRRGEKEGEPVPSYDVLFYDYVEDQVLTVTLDAEFEVDAVETSEYQPALTDAERERAVALAREDEWLAERLHHELIGRTLIAPTDSGHRMVDVRFMREDQRLPEYMAIVDLSEEAVKRTGSVGQSGLGSGLGVGGGFGIDPILDESLRDLLRRRQGFDPTGGGSDG